MLHRKDTAGLFLTDPILGCTEKMYQTVHAHPSSPDLMYNENIAFPNSCSSEAIDLLCGSVQFCICMGDL